MCMDGLISAASTMCLDCSLLLLAVLLLCPLLYEASEKHRTSPSTTNDDKTLPSIESMTEHMNTMHNIPPGYEWFYSSLSGAAWQWALNHYADQSFFVVSWPNLWKSVVASAGLVPSVYIVCSTRYKQTPSQERSICYVIVLLAVLLCILVAVGAAHFVLGYLLALWVVPPVATLVALRHPEVLAQNILPSFRSRKQENTMEQNSNADPAKGDTVAAQSASSSSDPHTVSTNDDAKQEAGSATLNSLESTPVGPEEKCSAVVRYELEQVEGIDEKGSAVVKEELEQVKEVASIDENCELAEGTPINENCELAEGTPRGTAQTLTVPTPIIVATIVAVAIWEGLMVALTFLLVGTPTHSNDSLTVLLEESIMVRHLLSSINKNNNKYVEVVTFVPVQEGSITFPIGVCVIGAMIIACIRIAAS